MKERKKDRKKKKKLRKRKIIDVKIWQKSGRFGMRKKKQQDQRRK